MAVNKIDPKVIFASEAPAQDTPAVFTNRTVGWGETRKNGGRPTIKQMNAEQQSTDLKILWLNENSVTPYDPTIDYPLDAVTIKDGVFKIFDGSVWEVFLDKTDIGLGNVDNTSDLNKPISTSTQTALDLKADKSYLNVRSIAELLAISNPKGGDIIFVESYHFGLLKGGGFFQYDQTQSNKNDGGLVINGWVRFRNSPYIHPEWFGAKGDGISDDYDALVKCFTSVESRPPTIYDANIKQWSAKSATFMLDSVVYRHTQPLMMPIMADVTSVGAINYFAYKNAHSYNSKPTFFYDGTDIEVAAVYAPFYKNNGNGSWSLNTNSAWTENTGDGTIRSMSVGCNYRFNIITKRNTKIGFNAFGFESGVAELGIGTIGSYAADQTEASALQSQDYNYDDLSPRVGIYAKRAWNSKFVRPRIIAHKTGMYIGSATASLVIDTPYVNRQVDKATDAINLGVEFLPTGIVAEKSVTTAFVFESADAHLIDPVCEHWGAAYMISNSVVAIDKPHVEGSGLIMNHDFIVYNSKISVNDWSAIRTMNAREGTSIVYSCGMNLNRGDFFALRGAGYYADNSLFNLVDGVGYNSTTNWEFLSVENMPRDKLFGACWATDLRYINKIEGLKDNTVTLYLNPSRLGAKGLGASFATASQSISDLNEAIRILGDMWSGSIEIRSNLTVSTPQTLVSNKDSIKVTIPSGVALTTNGASLSINGVTNMDVDGAGTLQISSPMFRPSGSGTFGIAVRGGLTISGASALLQCNDFFGAKNIDIYSGDLSAFSGNYAFSTSGGGSVNLSVQATTRNLLNEISTRRVEAVGHSVAAYFKNNLPSISSSIASTLIAANTQVSLGTLTLTGLIIGDTLLCTYSVPTLGIQLRAEVTNANTVTVFAYNPTASSITLPAGTITARKIYFNS